ncbi:MAG: M20/M25/M40 family metallo-hydrolase [Gemmatimonadota bacterium]|nr:M20/M25/M40 family metallo-hydrolase [Gemmatimonadota bacterium]
MTSKHRARFAFVAGWGLLVSCAQSPPSASAPVPARSETPSDGAISVDQLRSDLSVFASDSFLGREAGTPNSVRAAQFIASRLGELGLEPAGDSGYLQRVPLVRETLSASSTFRVTTPNGSTDLVLWNDLIPIPSLGPQIPLPSLNAAGDLVFAGYGDDPSKLNVRGKVVVVVNGGPATLDSLRRAEAEAADKIPERLGKLVPLEPAAIVILLRESLFREYSARAMQAANQGEPTPAWNASETAKRPLPMILLGVAREGSPLLPGNWPKAGAASSLTGRRFSGRAVLERADVPAYNVVAILRGRDASRAGSFVAFGAHLDHVGIQRGVSGGDSIANGADDDGSGSMALLGVARSLVKRAEKPKRSTLFVWHTAEEKGLWGSEYFTQHPTVPIDSIVAQLNADMIGRNDPDSLYLVGPSAAPNGQSRQLGAVADSVNAKLARPFKINREWDSPTHPEQIYFRSDHYSYAQRGIPIVFFTSGLHADYHKVSDEVSRIDFGKLARVAEFMMETGVAVGNMGTRVGKR